MGDGEEGIKDGPKSGRTRGARTGEVISPAGFCPKDRSRAETVRTLQHSMGAALLFLQSLSTVSP